MDGYGLEPASECVGVSIVGVIDSLMIDCGVITLAVYS